MASLELSPGRFIIWLWFRRWRRAKPHTELSAPYTVLIASGLIAPGATITGPTCPAGYIWVLRDLQIVNTALAAGTFQIGLAGSGLPFPLAVTVLANQIGVQWAGRVTVTAGQQLAFRNTSTVQYSYWLSGYLLATT
jgi:hypothetical protein